MGFMKPKTPAPAPAPTAPVPTADPITTAQQTVTQQEAEDTIKKKKQLRAGKASLTVGLQKGVSVNVGSNEANKSGLSVGGA